MPVFIDQMLRKVEINTKPQRIISLVPSQTELLFDLGLDNEVIGITKFCIHPKHWLKEKNIVGGTKQLNLNKIVNFQNIINIKAYGIYFNIFVIDNGNSAMKYNM